MLGNLGHCQINQLPELINYQIMQWSNSIYDGLNHIIKPKCSIKSILTQAIWL